MHAPPTWISAPVRESRPDGRGKRLLIVVPYRNREAHLAQLLPALSAYFWRDGEPRLSPLPKVCIVEQGDDLPFNRGALCNIGFALHRDELDYVCFHDVDCLPVTVDYSYADLPTRLIAHGTRREENPQFFFGAVVALSKADFETVNGFSNGYFGWGFEDTDLLLRIVRNGMKLESRAGIFKSLQHAAAELDHSGKVRPEVLANRNRANSRFEMADAFWRNDGVSTLSYEVMDYRSMPKSPAQSLEVVHHRIALRH